MARRYYSSVAARTTLSSAVNDSATTISVVAVSGWPSSYPYTLILDQDTINEEIVTVTNRSGTTVSITRGQDGTTAKAHDAGATVNHGVSARDFDEPNAFINGTDVITTAMISSKAVTAAKVGSESATVGQTLVADGSGGASWGAAASAGGGYPDIFLLMGA